MFRIDFGSYDDNQNFNWKMIREIMIGDNYNVIDLGEITFKSKDEINDVLEKINPYIDKSVVSVVEN